MIAYIHQIVFKLLQWITGVRVVVYYHTPKEKVFFCFYKDRRKMFTQGRYASFWDPFLYTRMPAGKNRHSIKWLLFHLTAGVTSGFPFCCVWEWSLFNFQHGPASSMLHTCSNNHCGFRHCRNCSLLYHPLGTPHREVMYGKSLVARLRGHNKQWVQF